MCSRRLFALFALPACLFGCNDPHSSPRNDDASKPRVGFEIAQGNQLWGTITIELEDKKAPITTANFLRYVDEGYYDNTLIHRVIVGQNVRIQVMQGGGYTAMNATSKPGQHAPIRNEADNGLRNAKSTIAMARDADPHSATSEYFVNLGDNPSLDYPGRDGWGYCVFGRIVDGWDVVERIKTVETTTNPDPVLKGEKSTPLNPPVVKRAYRIIEPICGGVINRESSK